MSSRWLGRIVLVPLGLMAGCAVALLVAVNVGLETVGETGFGGWRTGWGLARELAGVRSLVAVAPALLVVLISEIARVRSVLVYLAGGALAMVLAPMAVRLAAGGLQLPSLEVARVLAIAGMAGGYAHWWIAGRSS